MPRLTNPETGVTVSVDEDYAKDLKGLGWTEPKAAAKAPAPARRAKSDD